MDQSSEMTQAFTLNSECFWQNFFHSKESRANYIDYIMAWARNVITYFLRGMTRRLEVKTPGKLIKLWMHVSPHRRGGRRGKGKKIRGKKRNRSFQRDFRFMLFPHWGRMWAFHTFRPASPPTVYTWSSVATAAQRLDIRVYLFYSCFPHIW